jgi:SnoaL-like domain
MSTAEVVDRYYDAWAHRQGDLTDVPLADDFRFTGPVASFDSAAGFREMARLAGARVRNYRMRNQFHDGDVVVSIVDWEMDGVPGRCSRCAMDTWCAAS